jgi:hypothetical protein
MQEFDRSFRQLLSRYIPQTIRTNLDRHESILARRNQLRHELSTLDETTTDYDACKKAYDELFDRAGELVSPFAKEYQATLRLWEARRRIGLEQNDFAQIPQTVEDFGAILRAQWRFYGAQFNFLKTLFFGAIRYYITKYRP